MEDNLLPHVAPANWYSEAFISNSVISFLKESGYKIHRESSSRETEKIITATKFFKKEVIEVKGFPYTPSGREAVTAKNTHAKSWFAEALFNSFINFTVIENAEVAMALPNVSRYRAIIEKLYDYFSANDLYFRIYLVNEDGSVEVSNLNLKYSKTTG